MQPLMAKFDTSSKASISVEMLAKAMVANALDKSKEAKFEIVDNYECVIIAKATNTSK